LFDKMVEREKLLLWGFMFRLFDLLAFSHASALIQDF
jgi:hypothetical protein